MTEKYESDEEKIDWMKTFVLDEDYQSAYEILMKIDEIVRVTPQQMDNRINSLLLKNV